jgi:hypothetical protein
MKRLIEKTVLAGLVIACRFATWPTRRSPLLENHARVRGAEVDSDDPAHVSLLLSRCFWPAILAGRGES